MTVRETEILVERPPERRMPRASDIKVLVDGRRVAVERVESAGDDSPWHLVLYIDPELAAPGTLFYSLLALANQAETLTGLGSVEVLEAGLLRPLVEPTRDPRAIRFALGDLAGRARLDRDLAERQRFGADDPAGKPAGEDRAERTPAGSDRPATGAPSTSGPAALKPESLTLAAAGRRLDLLVARLTERRPTGPHALFLIADGSDPKLAPPFEAASRLLAGYSWVTFPILVQKQRTRSEIFAAQTELEVFRQSSDVGAKNNMSIPDLLPTHSAAPTTLSIEGVVELLFDPEVAGFRALAQQTAGAVIGREAQLAPALDRLNRRMRVWIDESELGVRVQRRVGATREGRAARAPQADLDAEDSLGRLRRLEVVRIKNDQSLRASAYLRASTPEELTATRLRLFLAGEALKGDFDLDAGWAPANGAGSSPALRLRFERPHPSEEDGEPETGPVRVTWGWIGAGGEVETRSRLFAAKEMEGGGASFARDLPLDLPAGVTSVAVVVDDLVRESWGGVVLGRPVR